MGKWDEPDPLYIGETKEEREYWDQRAKDTKRLEQILLKRSEKGKRERRKNRCPRIQYF